MNITPHFTMAEVTFSQTAIRHGIDNSLPENLKNNALRQAELMEKIRFELGKPIFITSWYRCPELNARIGGSPTSTHMKALACDFVSPFGSPRAVALAIVRMGLEFDQLIYEGSWVHIGLSEGPLRQQIMTATFPQGRVLYSPGIE